MSNQNAEAIRKLIVEQGPHAKAGSLPELRLAISQFYEGFATPMKLAIQEVLINGLPGRWIGAPEAEPHRTVLFFHGGGYSAGSARGHQDLWARLSQAARARVLSFDYRLAPENPFPAAVEDCLAAASWLLDKGVPAKRLALAGISSGATLALTTLLGLRDKRRALPAGAVLISPVADLTFPGASMQANQEFDWLSRQRLEGIQTNYLAGADPANPLASPIKADLSGLPPLLIQAGGHEVMLEDIRALADKARASGVEVTYQEAADMFHGWQIYASRLPEGQAAIESAGAFLNQLVP